MKKYAYSGYCNYLEKMAGKAPKSFTGSPPFGRAQSLRYQPPGFELPTFSSQVRLPTTAPDSAGTEIDKSYLFRQNLQSKMKYIEFTVI